MLKLFISLTLIIAASCWLPYATQDHIIYLGEPTWPDARGDFGHGMLVYFYEPSCLQCKQFWPEYKTAAYNLAENSKVNMSKVDCHDEIKLCIQEGVSWFPSIYLYNWWGRFEYTGPRNAIALEKWVRRNVDFEYEELSTDDELFKRHSTAILLSEGADYVKEANKELAYEIEIGYAVNNYKQGLGEIGGIVTQGGLVEKLPNNMEEIKRRVRELLVPNFGQRQGEEIRWDQNKNYLLYFRTGKFDHKADSAKAFDKLAKEYGDKIGFYYVNVIDDIIGSNLAKQFGVTNESEITLGIASQDRKVLRKYKLRDGEALTEASIRGFVDDWKSGRLNRYYMSGPVPAQNPRESVVELSGISYNQVINNATLNALVMLYYPECEWCTKLDLIWKALAYRYRSIDNLMIAKLDVTANDVEGFDFSAYPAVLFHEAKSGANVVEYLSDKTMSGFKAFLEPIIPKMKDIEL